MIVSNVESNMTLVLHHIITLALLLPPAVLHAYPHEIIFTYCIGEISGPMMHGRELCKLFDIKGPVELTNSILFCVVFIIFRTIVPELYLMDGVVYGSGSLAFKIVMVSGYWIGYVFIWQILNMFPKVLNKEFPDNSFFKNWYGVMRIARQYYMVYYIGIFAYCGRGIVVFYWRDIVGIWVSVIGGVQDGKMD